MLTPLPYEVSLQWPRQCPVLICLHPRSNYSTIIDYGKAKQLPGGF
jgi:hypothetical protein